MFLELDPDLISDPLFFSGSDFYLAPVISLRSDLPDPINPSVKVKTRILVIQIQWIHNPACEPGNETPKLFSAYL